MTLQYSLYFVTMLESIDLGFMDRKFCMRYLACIILVSLCKVLQNSKSQCRDTTSQVFQATVMMPCAKLNINEPKKSQVFITALNNND